jgi:hypothetical protein
MLKVRMVPHLKELGGESGINAVVQAISSICPIMASIWLGRKQTASMF